MTERLHSSDTERLTEVTEEMYKTILKFSANDHGVNALEALRISGGFLGLSLFLINVPYQELEYLEPGESFRYVPVLNALAEATENLLEISGDEGLDGNLESGWNAAPPKGFDEQLDELPEVIAKNELAMIDLLVKHQATWKHCSLMLVFVICRLIKKVKTVIPEETAKSIVMESIKICATTTPLNGTFV